MHPYLLQHLGSGIVRITGSGIREATVREEASFSIEVCI